MSGTVRRIGGVITPMSVRPATSPDSRQCSADGSRFYGCLMRTAFHEQLESLTDTLSKMCDLAGMAMERATQALLHADLTLAEQVIAEHDQLLRMRTRAEDVAFALLALQAPVAGDLRTVVASMQNVADAERMGGLALHVAKIARRRHPNHALPDTVNDYFAKMGRIAVDLGRSAASVVLSRDPEQAAQISWDDEEMNQLHQYLFILLKEQDWPHGVSAAVDVALLGRFYERFADHTVEIGRRVIFQATGESP
jgi:phosphate transport system protein